MAPDSAELVARIYNAAWMVRHYARGGRTSIAKSRRTAAIRAMGIVIREAFSESEDYEALIVAVVTSLSRQDERPF